jgi:hypothetical protein
VALLSGLERVLCLLPYRVESRLKGLCLELSRVALALVCLLAWAKLCKALAFLRLSRLAYLEVLAVWSVAQQALWRLAHRLVRLSEVV